MKNGNGQNTEKLTELELQSQYKLLTFELTRLEYQDVKIESIKRQCKIRDLVAEIFRAGWKNYQQEKQKQSAA